MQKQMSQEEIRKLWLDGINAEFKRREDEKRLGEAMRDGDRIREECRTLIGFIRNAWHVLEPSAPLKTGWAIEAIADHLDATTRGEILRLLINVPPGAGKSLLCNVFLPAYVWGPCGRGSERFACTSYGLDLTNRDGDKFLKLITSDWYKALWSEIEVNKFAVDNVHNTKIGFRVGFPWNKSMGKRAGFYIFDDPHDLVNAESDVQRESTVRVFKEGASSRLNDQETGVMIGIMQRLHENDVSGYIIENDPAYEHLCIPHEFEVERKCITYRKIDGKKVKFWEDPRKKDGELFFPERFSRAYVDKEKDPKAGIGPYAWASQHQQRPMPRGGGMFQRKWFEGKILKPWEVEKLGKVVRQALWWDLAATDLKALQKTGARTAGVRMGITRGGDFIIFRSDAFGKSGSMRDAEIKRISHAAPQGTEIFIPQDPAAGGKTAGQALIRTLAGLPVKMIKETGDKVARASPFANQCEAGNVYLVEGDYVEELLSEYEGFPNSSRKDIVDASANVFAELIKKKPTSSFWGAAAAKLIPIEQSSDSWE